MSSTGTTVLVTGGAGLIGAHMCEHLTADADVATVIAADDLSKGNPEWVPDDAAFVRADLTDPDDVRELVTEEIDLVFHFAARSDANDDDPRQQYVENVEMQYNLLERMRAVGVTNLAVASSSAVYGEAPRPTPEDYAPLEPISEYGASKLAGEGLLSTYAHSYGFTTWQFRFANVVGPHQRDNVVPDFVEKLLADPETLEILGDGRQEKSYIHVEDCVDAMYHVVEHADEPITTVNVGTTTTTSVTEIADIVSDVMGLDPEYAYTGGDRGWTGDVPKMKLSTQKLQALGWTSSMSSEQAIRTAAEQLYRELREGV